jgi:hypothetical protein
VTRLVLAVPLALVLAAAPARAQSSNKPDVVDETMSFVVPPGLEAVLTDMLGGDDALPGGCRLVSARALSTWIRAGWQCDGGLQPGAFLQHPSVGGDAVFETPKFKVKRAGNAAWPQAFGGALEVRLKARGDKFEWQAPTKNAVVPPGTFKAPPIPEGTVGTQAPAGLMNAPGESGWVPPKPKVKIVWTYVVLGILGAAWLVSVAVRWRRAIRARAAAREKAPGV